MMRSVVLKWSLTVSKCGTRTLADLLRKLILCMKSLNQGSGVNMDRKKIWRHFGEELTEVPLVGYRAEGRV